GSGVSCWGVGKRGQLGTGKRDDEPVPKAIPNGVGFNIRIVQVSAGGGLVRVAHTLLLTDTGRVLSFGCAQYGQLGHGFSAGKQLPDETKPRYIEYLSGMRITNVSAGELHSACVNNDGDLYTWGEGFCGQLGHADKRPQLTPKKVEVGDLEYECVETVDCGSRQTVCVTEEGEVFSFGLGWFGVLGSSNLTLVDNSTQCIPKKIEALDGIKILGISVGHRHVLALDEDGVVYSWGSGGGGALGHGDFVQRNIPERIDELVHVKKKVTSLSAGVDISMVVVDDGGVFSWGRTKNGRNGLGMQESNVAIPRQVQLGEHSGLAVSVEAAYVHSLIVLCTGQTLICGGVGINDSVDGADAGDDGLPRLIQDDGTINCWQRGKEIIEIKKVEKWKKYGKYETKGRA
ncbi:hypothetical protein TL16_g06276, partial [Triparma laevis f. inornata]